MDVVQTVCIKMAPRTAAKLSLLVLATIVCLGQTAEEAQDVGLPERKFTELDQRILNLYQETQLKFADINMMIQSMVRRLERLEQMMGQHLEHHSASHDTPHQHVHHDFQSHHDHQHSDDHQPQQSHQHDYPPHDHPTQQSHQHDHPPHDHPTQQSHQHEHPPHDHPTQQSHQHDHNFHDHSAETSSHEEAHQTSDDHHSHEHHHESTDDLHHHFDMSEHHSSVDHDTNTSPRTEVVEPPIIKSRAWQTGLGEGPRSGSPIDARNLIHGAPGNTSVWVNSTHSFNFTRQDNRSDNRAHHHHHHDRTSTPPVRHATYFKHGNHFHLITNINFDSDEYIWATCEMRPSRALSSDLQQNVTGRVNLWQHKTSGFLYLHLNLTGFAMGRSHLHGFHAHEKADLSAGCEKVGPHFNPHGHPHGSPEDHERHVGDFGNIKCDQGGYLNGYLMDRLAALRPGENSIMGRPLVINAHEDDLGFNKNNPNSVESGNAGPKIACCLVTPVGRLPRNGQ